MQARFICNTFSVCNYADKISEVGKNIVRSLYNYDTLVPIYSTMNSTL